MIHRQFIRPLELSEESLDKLALGLRNDSLLLVLAALESLPSNLPINSSLENKIAQGYFIPHQREGFLARRRIARAIAGRVLGVDPAQITIGTTPAGAPVFGPEASELHLSFSAREEWALIGLSREPIGVDLEICRPGMEIPWNMLRADERSALEDLPPGPLEQAFSCLWAAKEASAKLLGQGFRIPPEAIRLDGFPHSDIWRSSPTGNSGPGANFKPISVQTFQTGLNLRNKMLDADLTGGLVVVAASFA